MSKLILDVLWRDQGATKGVQELGVHVEQTGEKTNKWKDRTKAAFAIGAAAVVAFGVDSVKAYAEAEEAQNQLADAFSRFPALANINIEALREFNAELAKKTRFDDDAIASGQAVLANFKLTGQQLKSITPTLLDYAAKTGQDLPGAAEKLGKSFLGNTKALKELGITYKSTGNQAKDTENIIALLRNQVGGFAEKEGKTAAGQAAILKNQFGEIQEEIGEKLMPILIKVAEIGLAVFKWVDENKEAATIIGGIVAAIWLLNAALAANPAVLVAAGIALVIGGLVLLWTQSAMFRLFWTAMWNDLMAVVANVAQFFKDVWTGVGVLFNVVGDKIVGTVRGAFDAFTNAATVAKQLVVDRFNSLVSWFGSLGPNIGRALGNIGGIFSNAFKGAVNAGIDVINYFVRKANDLIRNINVISPFADIPPISQIGKMHGGGIVPGSPGQERLTILEAGEIVQPANRREQAPQRSTGATVTFAGNTDGAFATAFMKLVRDGSIQIG